jgi:uncharacterized repeat protein (TIGR03803 family)
MNKPIYVGLVTGKTLRIVIGAILLVSAGRTFNAGGQTLTTLWNFTFVYGFYGTNGVNPYAPLVQGSDGNFYGTALAGGANDLGCVFQISPTGNLTNLHSFNSNSHVHEGIHPYTGLVQGRDGNFYGTTEGGGTSNNGTVFRISPVGSFTNLYSFNHSATNGFDPRAGLALGSDGNFYGTTYYGGTSTNCGGGCGTVFRITPSGNVTNLYSFTGSDGAFPEGTLVMGSDGNFYGTTYQGGASNCGTMFRVTPTGNLTNLYSFSSLDGANPYTGPGLIQGSDGNFYGTTEYGGTSTNCGSQGCGTVFRISPSGNYSNLYSFSGSPTDGANPWAGLVQGSDGNFYGTTYQGGNTNIVQPWGAISDGTVFRITPSGSLTVLYSFSVTDGYWSVGGLVQGSDGSFYGTTSYGGTNTGGGAVAGTVFQLTVPLNPPANQISSIQIAGSDVAVSIPSITYETYQLQFSSSMNPTNWVNVPVSVTNSIGALLTLTNFGGASQPQGFYRFDITP